MVGQTFDHSNQGAEQQKAESGKLQCRAAALKIKKIIRRCKADTKTIKRLDDEQKELLERMRKHL
jgi:hypothetical protein